MMMEVHITKGHHYGLDEYDLLKPSQIEPIADIQTISLIETQQ